MPTRCVYVAIRYIRTQHLFVIGMSYEKLSEPEKAIEAYSAALPLLNVVEIEIPRTFTPSHSSSASFEDYCEVWRWTERLMFRAISLLSRVSCLDDRDGLIWTMFTHYHACSAHWPVKFRARHRSIVAVLHLRALVIHFQTSSTTATPISSIQSANSSQWLGTARSVINEYRTILDSCTCFPKAGERNVKVEDFVDLCVAVWETSGAMSDRVHWVLDVRCVSWNFIGSLIQFRFSGGQLALPSIHTAFIDT